MSAHKKKGEHEEVSEAWLLPYSDLMTLLLAVFIVLFAVSKVDMTKAESIAAAFKGIMLSGNSILNERSGQYSPIDGGDTQNQVPIKDPEAKDNTGLLGEKQEEKQGEKQGEKQEATTTAPKTDKTEEEERLSQELLRKEQIKQEQMDSLRDSISSYIDKSGFADNFIIHEGDDMLTLTVSGDVLFASGSAKLNAAQIVVARNLGEMIQTVQDKGLAFNVLVSGHTDNVPISKGSQFTSNWNLSLERAASFMSAMIEGTQLDPRYFTAVGHGELDPVDTNDTVEGKARNRRVEIEIKYNEKALADLDKLVKQR